VDGPRKQGLQSIRHLRQSSDRRLDVFDTVNDDRAGSAALHGGLGYSVDVRVVPIEPLRFIFREVRAVLEGLPESMIVWITWSP